MQPTRQKILELLKERGQATVKEIAETVGLTQMAVRHHLNALSGENLVITTSVRRVKQPGRPQQLYTLTEAASQLFPEDYHQLASYLLDEVEATFGTQGLDELLHRIANRMAGEAPSPHPNQSPERRLDQLVQFLGAKGFAARWTKEDDDHLIWVLACPYRQIARAHKQICHLDRQIIKDMLQVTPVRLTCMADGDARCTYNVGHFAGLLYHSCQGKAKINT